jgi:8-oxo-dGTP pyrophosphatase MutT (NUDIX family)
VGQIRRSNWAKLDDRTQFASEGYFDAARRRFRQELGVSASILSPLGKTEMEDDGCLKFITLFRSVSDGPFNYDRAHIDSVEFVPVPAVERMIEKGSRQFTPTFLRVFKFYRSLRLGR